MKNEFELVILSLAYLPPIEYIAQFFLFKNSIIEKDETYPKQTFRNRCYIYGPNGIQMLNIPVIKMFGNHTQTKDVRISNATNWQLNHIRSIDTAYNNSPYYIYYKDKLEPFYSKKYNFLLDYNLEYLSVLLDILKCENNISQSNDFIKIYPESLDLRKKIHPAKERILQTPRYSQVFEERYGFIPNLSILDLLFNKGPEAKDYLKNIHI